MSFAEGIHPVRFDLADPLVMLYIFAAVVVVFMLLDAPAIAAALRFLRLKLRLGKAARNGSSPSRTAH